MGLFTFPQSPCFTALIFEVGSNISALRYFSESANLCWNPEREFIE